MQKLFKDFFVVNRRKRKYKDKNRLSLFLNLKQQSMILQLAFVLTAIIIGARLGGEIVAEAVEAAKKNAAQNGLTNCEFIADDVLKALDNIEIKPDFIVLDPPRDGIHPKALEKIIDYGVDRMVYISCKPTSLARDLITLQERGYKVEKCCCVDMFPNTGHVETVVLLSQLK